MVKFVSIIAVLIAGTAHAQTVVIPSTNNVMVPANSQPCVKQVVADAKERARLIRRLQLHGMMVTVTTAGTTKVVSEGDDMVRPSLNRAKVALDGC